MSQMLEDVSDWLRCQLDQELLPWRTGAGAGGATGAQPKLRFPRDGSDGSAARMRALHHAVLQSEPFRAFLHVCAPSVALTFAEHKQQQLVLLPGGFGGKGGGAQDLLSIMCEEVLLESDALYWQQQGEVEEAAVDAAKEEAAPVASAAKKVEQAAAQQAAQEAVARLRACGAKKRERVGAQVVALAPVLRRVLSHISPKVLEGELSDDMVLYLCARSPVPSDAELRSIVSARKPVRAKDDADEEESSSSEDEDASAEQDSDPNRPARREYSLEDLGYSTSEWGVQGRGAQTVVIKTFLKMAPKTCRDACKNVCNSSV
jgi:hypothetical protein